MSILGLQESPASASVELTRTIDSGVLTPIPGDLPSGKDIRGTLMLEIRKKMPKGSEGAESNGSDFEAWKSFRDTLESTLITTTKDLELGVFLAEANTRIHEFDGLRDGLWIVTGLIKEFLHQGLHPQWEDGSLSGHHGKLEWLVKKLPDMIGNIPLTCQPYPGPNYSLNYLTESGLPGGMITAADFNRAAEAGATEDYEALAASILQAKNELGLLDVAATKAYGEDAPSFRPARDLLDRCWKFAQGMVEKRAPKPAEIAPSRKQSARSWAASSNSIRLQNEPAIAPSDDAWGACEQMARSGNVDGAIAAMATLAAREPTGRVRFMRRLMLADLCLQSSRTKLATRILEELNEIIADRSLDRWESVEMIGGVWTRLLRCYRDKAAGTRSREKEVDLFAKLSRLDPWQAVACGEPREEQS